ncbi:MAG: peptide deformylase, partial [Bacteroidales bacterium]|nr:peptide deformylase [Bacteroidales bacterium]
EVYLNPKIVQYSQLKQERREGCLSVPDRRGDPKSRSYAILLEYNRADMSLHREMVEGFTAIIFQHEIDHLNGVLFTDYLKN